MRNLNKSYQKMSKCHVSCVFLATACSLTPHFKPSFSLEFDPSAKTTRKNMAKQRRIWIFCANFHLVVD